MDIKTILLTKHWDITTIYSAFEIMLPDGNYILWGWDNNHKLIEKDILKIG